MKVLIFEFRQETNSFNPAPCTLEAFERGGIAEGQALVERVKGVRCAVSGMLSALEEAGAEAVPGYSMVSQSGGLVEQAVVEQFMQKALQITRQNLPVDGVFVSLHGATQSTGCFDVCGHILSTLREAVGQNVVITASCDMHANATELMIQSADFICGYHTYPHKDYFEVGYRAAQLGIQQLGGAGLHMASLHIPMIVPASGYTTQSGPFRELIQSAEALVEGGELSDFSVFQMQPRLDVPKGGTCVLCVAKDRAVAAKHAKSIATRLLALRHQFKPELYTIEEVVKIAEENTDGKPVILVDSADSTNAGASGDSMEVVRRLLALGSSLKAATVVDDPAAADLAHKTGAGKTITLSLGGTKDPVHSGGPLEVTATIKGLYDGVFVQEGPAGKGLKNNIGPTAVLAIGNIDVVVCHGVAGNGDPQLYRAFGVEPLEKQLVVVKACTSFRSAYCLISDKICLANTPGAASADLFSFEFNHLPKSFFPFSTLEGYELPEPSFLRG